MASGVHAQNETLNIRGLEGSDRQKDIERLEKLRPIDDDFMRVIYRDDIPLTEDTLRIVTGIEGLKVVHTETQKDLKRLVGARSVELDVMAVDSSGRWHDIEVQRGDEPRPRRARHHSAAMDVEALDAGHEPEELPEQWVIFIMEHDPFGKGQGTYLFERAEKLCGERLADGTNLLYANGDYRADDELGDLMRDFHQSEPDAMRNARMAERVRYFKRTPKGMVQMCEIFDEIRQEGEERMLLAILRNLMEKFSLTAQEAFDMLSVPNEKRQKYLAML